MQLILFDCSVVRILGKWVAVYASLTRRELKLVHPHSAALLMAITLTASSKLAIRRHRPLHFLAEELRTACTNWRSSRKSKN
jgi:hypothetical protein